MGRKIDARRRRGKIIYEISAFPASEKLYHEADDGAAPFACRHLNLISETARHTGEQTLFDGVEMKITENGTEVCNPAYWNAVLAFLNSFDLDFVFDYSIDDYIADLY